jgi:serine/threonine protein kinase
LPNLWSHLIFIIGYHAPEVIETKKQTQKYDVYNFGVLLLEMLIGKALLRSDLDPR